MVNPPSDQELLRQVSRSFYLTLRALPAAIRADLSHSYLLARASDTIADLATADPEIRLAALENLSRGEFAIPAFAGLPSAEAELLRRLPDLAKEADASIHELWKTILEGQIFDLRRFADPSPLQMAEVERYTYLVAGCVGEYWTRLCQRKLPDFSAAPSDWLVTRGIEFGRALQYVNLLRDRTEDASRGRVYLSPENLPLAEKRVRECLAGGWQYLRAIRPGRLKFACALPLRLAERTLAAISQRGPGAKVSRKVVYFEMVKALADSLTPARFLRKPRE